VTNQYTLYSFDPRRLLRLVLLLVSPGIITILCHAGSFFPPLPLNSIKDYNLGREDEYIALLGDKDAAFPDTKEFSGPPPHAEDDFATTSEETPVTINILENDRHGEEENKNNDDDDNDDDDDRGRFRIDSETVDLRPDELGIQSVHLPR
jgi:hypothetical protein